ncbi:hypothetical protein GCM10010313_29320 [Streptomyces violarus]|nr:hypothetical protein GCM10010313_29320 [Streptomyces violarus]
MRHAAAACVFSLSPSQARLFPSGQAAFHDGAQMPLDIALELVRVMLRDSGAWCRLEAEDTFAVHVGWDQYLYISSSRPCEEAPARTRELGLFPERLDAEPCPLTASSRACGRTTAATSAASSPTRTSSPN